jgi:hypothetical protein
MRRIALLLLLLVLSSCALTAPGKGEFTPLESDGIGNLVKVPGPGSWFVRTMAIASIPEVAFNRMLDDTILYEEINVGFVKRQSVNWAKIEKQQIPDGWELELVRQEASRTVTRVEEKLGVKDYWAKDRLNLTFRVNIPNGTPAGFYSLHNDLSVLGEKGIDLVNVFLQDATEPTP